MSKLPRHATKVRQTRQGEWLYEKRLNASLRQSDLAYKLGINQGRISEAEQGFRPLPDSDWARVQGLFGPCPHQ